MATIRAGGLDVWYERSRSDGPPLVLIHGFAGPSSAGWPPVIERFKQRFDLLLYDVRAHGRTTLPGAPADTAPIEQQIAALEASVPRFAADLAALLDALGIGAAHIGGVSMGGMIAAQFACDFPARLRSVLLCDTVGGNTAGPGDEAVAAERVLIQAFEQMESVVLQHGMTVLAERENRFRRKRDPYAHLMARDADTMDALNLRTKTQFMTAPGYVAANRALRARPDLTSRTPGIAAPVLISCGEWDLFYPSAARDHGLIPGSRFATIRGAAHATPDYQPDRWLRACSDFISDVEAARPVAGEITLAD